MIGIDAVGGHEVLGESRGDFGRSVLPRVQAGGEDGRFAGGDGERGCRFRTGDLKQEDWFAFEGRADGLDGDQVGTLFLQLGHGLVHPIDGPVAGEVGHGLVLVETAFLFPASFGVTFPVIIAGGAKVKQFRVVHINLPATIAIITTLPSAAHRIEQRIEQRRPLRGRVEEDVPLVRVVITIIIVVQMSSPAHEVEVQGREDGLGLGDRRVAGSDDQREGGLLRRGAVVVIAVVIGRSRGRTEARRRHDGRPAACGGARVRRQAGDGGARQPSGGRPLPPSPRRRSRRSTHHPGPAVEEGGAITGAGCAAGCAAGTRRSISAAVTARQ